MPIQKSSSRRATNLPARRLTGTTTSLNLPADLRRQQFRLDCGETDAHLPALFLDVFGWTRSGCVSCKAKRLNVGTLAKVWGQRSACRHQPVPHPHRSFWRLQVKGEHELLVPYRLVSLELYRRKSALPDHSAHSAP